MNIATWTQRLQKASQEASKLAAVSCCDTWPVQETKLFEYHLQNFPIILTFLRLKVLANMALRGTFGPKSYGVTGSRENYIMRCLITCTAHQILSG
jgi:hypothetical protein